MPDGTRPELLTKMKPDIIVVGAGIWGITVARTLADAGKRVLVLEKRSAPGGNCRTETDATTGIEVHLYGSHIFHTRIPQVWSFVNRFTTFNGYQHKVLARSRGKTYFLPLGLALINAFYGIDLKPSEVRDFVAREAGAGTRPPRNLEEKAISMIGLPLYEAFIKGYTAKQWNTAPASLPASIITRLPVRSSYDINYYNDPWQGIPTDGYQSMMLAMLDHPAIDVRCGVDFLVEKDSFLGKGDASIPVFYSGPIDELFDYRFGPLPWRSLRFERETVPVADFQGTSVVNYVERDVPFTRIHEYKHYHPERGEAMACPTTEICREYPAEWTVGGSSEPFYPINTSASEKLLDEYRTLAASFPNLIVGGRLGEYKYYDMDQAISRGLEQANAWLQQL